MNLKNIFKKLEKPKYQNFDSYWIQNVKVNKVLDRVAYFKELCSNKKVIHFGCTDWPIFDASWNLHIILSTCTEVLHGFDIDKEGIENLKKYVNQEYFTEFSQIPNIEYDICLVPETIEHVDNVRTFLEGLSNVNAKKFIITAPNCFSKEHLSRNFYGEDFFIEVVHPDHNCWYSPYTLKNQIEKYSSLKVTSIKLLEEDKMICCEAKKI